MRAISVIVDEAPHKNLLINQRNKLHWSLVGDATTGLRKAAKYCAMNARPEEWEAIGWYRAEVEVYWPVSRYPLPKPGKLDTMPDLDTLLAACKPALDGLEDAGIIADDGKAVEYTIRQYRVEDERGWIRYAIEEAPEPPCNRGVEGWGTCNDRRD